MRSVMSAVLVFIGIFLTNIGLCFCERVPWDGEGLGIIFGLPLIAVGVIVLTVYVFLLISWLAPLQRPNFIRYMSITFVAVVCGLLASSPVTQGLRQSNSAHFDYVPHSVYLARGYLDYHPNPNNYEEIEKAFYFSGKISLVVRFYDGILIENPEYIQSDLKKRYKMEEDFFYFNFIEPLGKKNIPHVVYKGSSSGHNLPSKNGWVPTPVPLISHGRAYRGREQFFSAVVTRMGYEQLKDNPLVADMCLDPYKSWRYGKDFRLEQSADRYSNAAVMEKYYKISKRDSAAYTKYDKFAEELNGQLLAAALHGRTEIVTALLAKGADANAKAVGGMPVLMFAISGRSTGVVKALLDNGADVNAANNDGETALAEAVRFRSDEIADLLRQAGAKE